MSTWFFILVSIGLSLIIQSVSSGSKDSTKIVNDPNRIEHNINSRKIQPKSLSQYAKEKLASLQYLRNQLVQQQQQRRQLHHKTKLDLNNNQTSISNSSLNLQQKNVTKYSLLSSSAIDVHGENSLKSSVRDDSRQHFWANIIPNTDILKRLSRMRRKLEPDLRNYLTTKYNDFLTNLVDYSDHIGIPPFVLNSMKIPQSFDPRWNIIEKLLETSSLDKFLATIPELGLMAKLDTNGLLGKSKNNDDVVRGRSDDDFISDQEPQATSKGKKKYGGGLRLSNRVKMYRKGDPDYNNGPQRTGYEYGDQYGLYSHSSYDTSYGKGYDDYYSTKQMSDNDKGYIDYSGKGMSHVKNLVGKYSGIGLGSGAYADSYGAAGHNSYSYGGGHGHGGGGYGGGHGGGSGLTGYLDPFSILGGLAFLVYLGLLFQQSLNATGRSMPGSSIFDTTWKKPIVLTQLSFNDFEEVPHQRYGRSIHAIDDFDTEAVEKFESMWNNVEGIYSIQNPYCRQLESCHVIKDLYDYGLLNVFKEELEASETDSKFLGDLYNRLQTEGTHFQCGFDFECFLQRQRQTIQANLT